MSGGVAGPRGLSSGARAAIIILAVLVGGTTSVVAAAVTAAVVMSPSTERASSSDDTAVAAPLATAAKGTPSPSAPTGGTSPSPKPSPSASPTPSRTPTPTRTPRPTPRPSTPPSSGLVPVVGVVDGDTIKVSAGGRTERVRVIGIDTPELRGGECYAQQASSKMQSLVQSKKVRLVRDPSQSNRDRYDRLLRHVQLADGRQVAQLLIAGGFGEEYTYDRAYAGQAAYRAAERAAREAGKGIWSSGCLAPPPAAPGSCDIKGNISSSGERIYHVPGQRYYEVTKIDEAKGERWFCSEAEAVAAGWRKAKV